MIDDTTIRALIERHTGQHALLDEFAFARACYALGRDAGLEKAHLGAARLSRALA